MERFALDADQAFAVLRRYSQNHNIKLRDVARRVVDTRRLPDSTGH
jgi:AmiR/NasT family two-component response regulator